MAVDKGMMDKLDQSRQTDTLGSKAALDVNELLLPATSPTLCLVLSHHSQLPSCLSPDLQEAFIALSWGPHFLPIVNAATWDLPGSSSAPLFGGYYLVIDFYLFHFAKTLIIPSGQGLYHAFLCDLHNA